MKLTWLWIVIGLAFQSASLAQTQIRFTARDLAAATVLLKPELNSLELNGQAGVFTPGPALRALGADEIKFDLNFAGLSQLAGIHFNHLKGQTPDVRFEGDRLTIIVPVEDQVRAAQSVLGTVGTKNIVLRVRLDWRARADGSAELYVASTGFSGTLTGTGVFRPSFMIALVEKLMLRTVADQAQRLLEKSNIQQAIGQGILDWAKFNTGQSWHEVVPGSVQFYTEGAESGLRYRVQ